VNIYRMEYGKMGNKWMCVMMKSKEYNMGPYGRANVQKTDESVMSRRQRMTTVPSYKNYSGGSCAYIILWPPAASMFEAFLCLSVPLYFRHALSVIGMWIHVLQFMSDGIETKY
jgi:hypothetical protein